VTHNPHLGSDALFFLNSVIPDTPSTHLVERQEIFRIALTQAMREVRQLKGLTQKQLAEKLGIGQSWVSKLESANNDHTFESVLKYLEALGADFEVTIIIDNQKLKVVAAKLGMTLEQAYTALEPIWEDKEASYSLNGSENLPHILPERQNDHLQVQKTTDCSSLWGDITLNTIKELEAIKDFKSAFIIAKKFLQNEFNQKIWERAIALANKLDCMEDLQGLLNSTR
jgi:transcriptional regulator with XRE-family HTH domain